MDTNFTFYTKCTKVWETHILHQVACILYSESFRRKEPNRRLFGSLLSLQNKHVNRMMPYLSLCLWVYILHWKYVHCFISTCCARNYPEMLLYKLFFKIFYSNSPTFSA